MTKTTSDRERRTTVDVIFDHLNDEISSMRLRPGDKISEAEIAAQFEVSRQPVRDAFARLENLDLIVIRPQRATRVKGFSMAEITKSRFVRYAVEVEVLRRAAENCDGVGAAKLDANLLQQAAIVEAGDYAAFGLLDYQFHQIICDIAKAPFAFDVIQKEKRRVDRLCVLSRDKENRMALLLEDHRAIAGLIKSHDSEGAVKAGALHLSRLDATIETILAANDTYFED